MNTALLMSDNPLRVRIVKIDKDVATLSLPDHQSFQVNKKYLPNNAKENDTLYLNLIDQSQLNQSKEKIAKAVLKEILG